MSPALLSLLTSYPSFTNHSLLRPRSGISIHFLLSLCLVYPTQHSAFLHYAPVLEKNRYIFFLKEFIPFISLIFALFLPYLLTEYFFFSIFIFLQLIFFLHICYLLSEAFPVRPIFSSPSCLSSFSV